MQMKHITSIFYYKIDNYMFHFYCIMYNFEKIQLLKQLKHSKII